MKQFTAVLVVVFSVMLIFGVSYAIGDKTISSDEALATLRLNYPQVMALTFDNQITRLYGVPFSHGLSAEDAADQFRVRFSRIFSVEPVDLSPVSLLQSGQHTSQMMYDPKTDRYKFTQVYYSQQKDGIPVFRSELRLLVRNDPGFPLIDAMSSLKNLGEFQVSPSMATIDPEQVQKSFLATKPNMVLYDIPKRVIWAGYDTINAAPVFGVEFIAWDATPASEKHLYIIDPTNNSILYQENQLIDVDITGQVNGNATEGWYSEQCGNEIARHLPYAKVTRSGGSTYADSTGAFVLTNPGSTPITVGSKVAGRYFVTHNFAGSDDSLGQSVTPPGPVTFLHNPTNTEQKRAEVNGYIQANVVRDYVVKYAPDYPTIPNEVDFPVWVNRNDGYCPGNAWYDGSSINFCLAGSDGTYNYPNTAYSTVVHHEYGHHVVDVGGSGQGAYGEGTGDVMGLLITDTSGAAYGFYGPCATPLRNADNNMQYPCSGEIHFCGQLISGCVWSVRNALKATNPTTYRDILSHIAIEAIRYHLGQGIDSTIALTYLQLDDDDDNLNNGTPHWNEICAGFRAHNMNCPPLNLLAFSYPNGRPQLINPQGGATMRVNVTGVGGVPQQNTGILHYKTTGNWLTTPMTQISPNVYDANFPAFTCGTGVSYYVSAQTTTGTTCTDPSNAPTSFYSTTSGTGTITVYQDDFSSNQGWTGLGGAGEWTIGGCTGGGSGQYGGHDPATDHSPSGANNVLGNDLTASPGGDYSNNLGQTYWITSPAIDCSGSTNISLSFWRWLGVERNLYDHAYFAVKNSSGTWTNIFANGSTTIDESAWTQYTYDVSAYANNNPNFQMRFGIGTTDVGWTYCGWNIDDIAVTAVACDTANNGTIAGTVTDSQGDVNLCRIHAFDGSGHNGYDTTGTDGAYSMNVAAGTYSVTFSQIDHRDTTVTGIVVTTNNTTTVNVVMQRLKGIVRGTVTSGPSAPINNVRVVVQGSGREDTTGSNGTYMIDNLTEGTYSIFFTNIDYTDTTVTNVSITPGDTTVLNMVMQPLPGWVSGTIRDTSGVAIESVFVRLNTGLALAKAKSVIGPHEGDPSILSLDSTYTNSSGYYLMHVASQTYSALFSRHDYRDTTIANVIVTPNDTIDVSPRMRPINHAPVITSAAADTATEHQPFTYLATATDPDGQAVTISYSSFPGWLIVHGDTIRGTPQEGNGNTTFRVIASDGELRDTLVVALTVIEINDPPVITSPDSATATEHVLFTYTATATDPEGLTPTIVFSNYASWLAPTGNQLRGTPPEGATDTTFTIIASDGSLADTMQVALRVTPVNDPPIITSPDSTVAMENTPFRYVATAFDPEGVTPIISFIRYPSWTSVMGDTIFGTPTSANSDTSFTMIASDGVRADTQRVFLQVVQFNNPPYLTSPDTATAIEHITFSYTATAVDPDGTTPSITFSHYPSWMTVNGNTISGNVGQASADTSFRLIASDGSLADTIVVSVHVILINDPPVITSADTTTAVGGQSFAYLAEAYDPEGVTPIITFINYASWMTPAGDLIGGNTPPGAADTSFSVIASDGQLAETLLVLVNVQSGCDYLLGDINGNLSVNGVDIVYAVNFFKGTGNPPPVDCFLSCPLAPNPFYAAGDVNGNCAFNGIDITFFVRYLKTQVPSLLNCPDCPPLGGPAVAGKPHIQGGTSR
jgi:hypothetical protein